MTNKLPKHPEEPWDVQRSHPHRYHDLHHVAPECDDQLALISGVGRGLRGDSYRIDVIDKDNDETYLQGKIYDAATNTWVDDWLSDNVNGGYLTAYITTNETTDPPTFTLTFEYSRPVDGNDAEPIKWTKTTPAIPYVIDPSPDGAVDFIDLAKILGLTEQNLQDILNDVPGVIVGDGFTGDNIKDYIDNKPTGISQAAAEALIDDAIDDLSDHIHEDMGFGTLLINDGNSDTKNPKRNTIKKWLEWMIGQMGFGTDIDNFDSTGATTIKQYIKNIYNNIATQLGFGDDIDEFGDTGADTVKEYIDICIENSKEEAAAPVMYTQTYDVDIAFYSTAFNASQPGEKLIANLVSNNTPIDTLASVLSVNYYDVMPMITFALDVKVSSGVYRMPDKTIGVATIVENNVRRPIDFAKIVLPHRTSTIKPPLLNPENLSNSGFSGQTNTGWQVYSGVGDCVSKDTGDSWTWGKTNKAYFYIFHRNTGDPGTAVHIDYGRTYHCDYNQSVSGS